MDKPLTLREALPGKARLTLRDAMALAEAHWESKGPSSRMMATRAKRCAQSFLKSGRWEGYPVDRLIPQDGTRLLTRLRNEKLSKASVQSYYAAFRSMLKLAGVSTADWPAPGNPPRRTREALSDVDVERLHSELRKRAPYRTGYWGYHPRDQKDFATADLLILLKGTGMRVDVEALSQDAWRWDSKARTLHVTGKGENERLIPVEDPDCIALLEDEARLQAMRRLSYSGHMKRWNAAVKALRISSKLPTPHAVRHWWATKVYRASGNDLRLAQELLGHSDVSTTARYVGVDVEAGREAIKRMAGTELTMGKALKGMNEGRVA